MGLSRRILCSWLTVAVVASFRLGVAPMRAGATEPTRNAPRLTWQSPTDQSYEPASTLKVEEILAIPTGTPVLDPVRPPRRAFAPLEPADAVCPPVFSSSITRAPPRR